jgi:hypothetical protein
MTMTTTPQTSTVQRSVAVKAGLEHAFNVFTTGFDTWWPRSHSIGKSGLQKAIIEARLGGRCYQLSVDGSECDWGRILVWEPPRRFVLAWQLNPKWECEPDLTRASEVEVSFTPEPDRVDPRRPRTPPLRSPQRRRAQMRAGSIRPRAGAVC